MAGLEQLIAQQETAIPGNLELSRYADQLVAKELGDKVFSFKGAMWLVISEGMNNDPSLMLVKRIAYLGEPPKPAAAPITNKVIDMGKALDAHKSISQIEDPELSFKLEAEKVPVEEKLEKAKKAAKKAKKEKK